MTFKLVLGLVALTLTACATATDRGATARTGSAEARWPPIGQFVEVDGQRVHAWIEGSGPDLVLIHGASGNLRDFTFRLADRLTDRYRVIAFDRPGLGYTERASENYGGAFDTDAESPAVQADMLARAAAQLGVENPIVLGHSYGGAVAMAWGLEQDASALVVVSGATMPWPGDLGAQYAVLGSSVGGALLAPILSATAGEKRINEAVSSIFAPQAAPAGYLDYVGAGLTLRPASLRANARQVNTLRPHVVSMSERYPRLDLPVELVHGDEDEIVPLDVHSRRLVERLPNARLTVLDGIGHMPHQVAPDAIVAAIDRAASRAGLR
ncbi:alpha/beta hydrolase fold protein [Roseivivax marinus]|jgi:pimeloyl-ACP methyl ester carboxylesterase|uniref:Alpha/beta hydrolase fold protein n=1 Tax=Roseivivax marinus TaxID=1379903 RepID=W4HQJ4_9RHOB|nr:alpha/beta hydrolase [Roseivivax marinus]ETW14703.1 alpha/beta hydrolase fold protein [Roseivivax marinus]SEL04030.1 Pimeloyl-ACP methyl ester carboxylesterase [Roseivivax marinus]